MHCTAGTAFAALFHDARKPNVVEPPAAQAGTLLNSTMSAGHVEQAAALIGMICATRILMFGLPARIWPTSFVNAASLVAVVMKWPHAADSAGRMTTKENA